MLPEIELIRHLEMERARSYAEIVRRLEWLIATAPVTWVERWHMRYDRWLYGLKLAQMLGEMPVEDRAAALGQGAENSSTD